MKYLAGVIREGRGACSLQDLEGVPDSFELDMGVSVKERWPDEARFRMSRNRPEDVKLEDFVFNRGGLLVVSQRVKKFLEKEGLKNIELLPVAIVNQASQKEKAPYWVVNQLGLEDAIDRERTKFEQSSVDKENFTDVQNLTLDESKIDADVAIFRLKHFPYSVFFREDLAKKIEAAGFSGMAFVDPKQYDG